MNILFNSLGSNFSENVDACKNNKHPVLSIFTDGASRGNPGVAGVGIVFVQNDTVIMARGYKIGEATNNVAEYLALVSALHLLQEEMSALDFAVLKICADSELLIKQLKGEYKVKNANLAKFHAAIKIMLNKISQPYTFCHVRRELNSAADKMANKGIDDNISSPSWLCKYLSEISPKNQKSIFF